MESKITREELFNVPDWQTWDDMTDSSKFHRVMELVNKYYYDAMKEGDELEDVSKEIINLAVKDKMINMEEDKFKRLGLTEWLSDDQRRYIENRLLPSLRKVHRFSTRFKGYEGLVNKDELIQIMDRILTNNGYTEREQGVLRKMTRLHRQKKTPFRNL